MSILDAIFLAYQNVNFSFDCNLTLWCLLLFGMAAASLSDGKGNFGKMKFAAMVAKNMLQISSFGNIYCKASLLILFAK